MNVLFEDNHLLVVNKPAGIATMGAEPGVETLHQIGCDYIRKKYKKPGKVFLGIVSRLDTMTSGVIVLARTSKAASRLSPQFASADGSGATKVYLAAVSMDSLESNRDQVALDGRVAGLADGEVAVVSDFVRKDDAARRMRVCDSRADGAKAAEMQVMMLGRSKRVAIVACRLLTGRKHQIRVQLAAAGCPVLGDQKYDSRVKFRSGIALHSWKLRITHPTLKQAMWFSAKPPKSWSVIESGDGSAYIRSNGTPDDGQHWPRIACSLGVNLTEAELNKFDVRRNTFGTTTSADDST